MPDEAVTASVLGTERAGHGIVVKEPGLVVTIGYLVMEAESVWLLHEDGTTVQGHVLGYDQETGLGLVQALGPLDAEPVPIGSADRLQPGDPVVVASHGGTPHALEAHVSAKREFAGYWEYVLDEALFTTPAHPSWGGAALLGHDGLLHGVGSLLVQETAADGETTDCNMFVPIDLLASSIDDLRNFGRPNRTPRPWLGMFVYDVGDSLVVAGVYTNGPADSADVRPGDVIARVGPHSVGSLSGLFRTIWSLGEAGVEVPLTLMRDSEQLDVKVRSVDRTTLGQPGQLH